MTYAGTRIKSLEIKELLGAGSFGEVWMAQDVDGRRQYAIKILKKAVEKDPRAIKSIVDEARLVAKIQPPHPGILRIYEADQHPSGFWYLIMDLLSGCSLEDRIKHPAKMPHWEICDLISQIADGLAAAHAGRVIHRDLKPANVMLVTGEHNRPRATIVDFGIALLRITISASARAPAPIVGTAAYMAPDQVLNSNKVDGRADVYSLGCIAFECLTFRLPFLANDVESILVHHIQSPVPSMRSIDPNIDEDLDTFVSEMLAKEPARRPTATEVSRRFAQFALDRELGTATRIDDMSLKDAVMRKVSAGPLPNYPVTAMTATRIASAEEERQFGRDLQLGLQRTLPPPSSALHRQNAVPPPVPRPRPPSLPQALAATVVAEEAPPRRSQSPLPHPVTVQDELLFASPRPALARPDLQAPLAFSPASRIIRPLRIAGNHNTAVLTQFTCKKCDYDKPVVVFAEKTGRAADRMLKFQRSYAPCPGCSKHPPYSALIASTFAFLRTLGVVAISLVGIALFAGILPNTISGWKADIPKALLLAPVWWMGKEARRFMTPGRREAHSQDIDFFKQHGVPVTF